MGPLRILMILIPDRDGGPGEPALRVERFAPAYYALVDAGAEVVLASPDGGSPWGRPARRGPEDGAPFGRRLQADRTAREAMADTLSLDQVFPDDFAAAFCVGEPGRLWEADPGNPAGGTIRCFLAAGKPVAIVPGGFDLAPHGAGEGLLVTGRSARSPLLAAPAPPATLAPPPPS